MIEALVTTMPFYICLFWAVGLLLRWIQMRDKLHLFLFHFMAVATVLYLCQFFFFYSAYEWMTITYPLFIACYLLIGPLLQIYLKGMTAPGFLSDKKSQYLRLIVAYVPALLFGGISLAIFGWMDEHEIRHFIEDYMYSNNPERLSGLPKAQSVVHKISEWVFQVLIIYLLVIGWYRIRKYNKLIEEYYADTEERQMNDMEKIWIMITIATGIAQILIMLKLPLIIEPLYMSGIPSIIIAIIFFLVGYVGYHQRFSVRDLMRDIASQQQQTTAMPTTIDSNDSDEPLTDELVTRIQQVVEGKQLFLQPDLKVMDVAQLLYTNRTYIQRAISEKMNTTFAAYINSLRIAYASQLMKEHPDMSIHSIATTSGYTNLATFYRNYKAVTGKAPRQE